LVFAVGLLVGETWGQCGAFPTVNSKGSFITPGSFCSPANVGIEYRVGFSTPLPVDGNTYRVRYDWGDGAVSYVNIVPGSSLYIVNSSHPYPPPGTAVCEYLVNIGVVKNAIVTLCTGSQEQKKVANWQTDQYNGGVVELITPGGAQPNTRVHEVCEGVNVDVIFQDRTIWNCNSSQSATYPPNDPLLVPNEDYRWQQIVYNTPNVGPTRIPNVSVNGVLMAPAAGSNYQDPRGVFFMASPVVVNDARRRPALRITAPGGIGAGFPQIGQNLK
jgi:hypothetical protein